MSDHHRGPPGGHHASEHHDAPTPGRAAPGSHVPPGAYESSNVSAITEVKGEVVKVFSEADTGFNLAVRGDEIVVAKAYDSDPYQQWIKDESWSKKAKDSAGLPAFALINKASGKALRHPPNADEKVLQAVFHQNSHDNTVLWTISDDVGKGWHAIRPISDIKLNLDIDHGSKKYGPIKDGQAVIIFKWKDEENQHWKITPIGASTTSSSHDHHHRH